ncbi:ABC transporter ATP-binding protein [Aureibacter tunicatorum]|uniref:ABC-type sugar transport system ATPase subunit n=1 Tax=Aureibacter tunicatorum TaxID=866807 RepID=A0AAE4BSU1_9BACT|nr:ABC transporter ATP-binding protein [Aureibacter tunicatorum]MDR6239173.1 ABC-type sugar transport system ATPase subunit [Aureibacter tunicatorum]BDD04901.1 phosphonate ABC transporter ATP-binding protein [Aureibacter tunicatorum]
MGAELLKVENVSKLYEATGVQALKNIEITVGNGECVGLVGQSGSGKSTLLKIIAGLEDSTEGRVLLKGKRVLRASETLVPGCRDIAVVNQRLDVDRYKSVYDNIAIFLRNYTKEYVGKKVRELLALCNLDGYEDKLALTLSGGEKQRVAIAQAIAKRALMIVFDEPFSNLDHHNRAVLEEEIKQIIKSTGIGALVITHNPQEVYYLCDRVYVLEGGQVMQSGEPESLYNSPNCKEVARIFGELNELANNEFSRPENVEIDLNGKGFKIIERRFFGISYRYQIESSKGKIIVAYDQRILEEGIEIGVSFKKTIKF